MLREILGVALLVAAVIVVSWLAFVFNEVIYEYGPETFAGARR